MTTATTIERTSLTKLTPTINYQVAMVDPHCHLFQITLEINNWSDSVLNLKMPVWTPGSY